jgi:S1-C subfamily serine protease
VNLIAAPLILSFVSLLFPVTLTSQQEPKGPPDSRASISAPATHIKPEDILAKADIHDLAMRATALVTALSLRESGQARTGTGILVDAKAGLVVTNAHVVGQKTQVRVTFPWYKAGGLAATDRRFYDRERPLEGTVAVLDTERDLALIRLPVVPNGIQALRLAKESAASGTHVYLMGNPGGDPNLWRENEATVKQVAARDVRMDGTHTVAGAAIVDLAARDAIRKGFSGGPVLNLRGELAGILFGAGGADAHLGLAIDVREVRDLMDLLKMYPIRAQELISPQRAADYALRGSYYLSHQRYDRAIISFSKAIELHEKAPAELYCLRGVARRKAGAARAAIADLSEAIRLDANNAAAYRERGDTFLELREYDRAIADYSEAIRLNPEDALAYAGRSQAHAKKGKMDEAKADQQKAVQINPYLGKQ